VPQMAAAWVSAASAYNHTFTYYEVGNEVFGSWEIDLNTRPHDPVTYATRFAQYMRCVQVPARPPGHKYRTLHTSAHGAA
jgi:hypothetical protein